MKSYISWSMLGILIVPLVLLGNVLTRCHVQGQEAKPSVARGAIIEKQPPFPDFGYVPPKDQYEGKLFRLRQDFPVIKPVKGEPSFFQIPFDKNGDGQKNWKKYLMEVRDYCFEGNITVDWDLSRNTKRKWYHVPWQHFGRNGREGIHGLTREATAQPKQLALSQTDRFQTYAIGFYNELGGYTIGKVWRDHYQPDLSAAIFPPGTVVCKILFTQATDKEVPYLLNPISWDVYAEISDQNQIRKVQKLQLLQLDVMIRDDRALRLNGTGWVFGTFCYNGVLGNPNRWYNLVPVGLQWGNDPTVTDSEVNPHAARTIINEKLKETVINDSNELPPQHLGWGGRLNGPADYFASSCMSCHSTAQYPVQAPMNPEFRHSPPQPRGSSEWRRWFRNLQCGEPFSEFSHSTDFSLQLAGGIKNSHEWRLLQGGDFARREEALRKHLANQFEVKRGKE